MGGTPGGGCSLHHAAGALVEQGTERSGSGRAGRLSWGLGDEGTAWPWRGKRERGRDRWTTIGRTG